MDIPKYKPSQMVFESVRRAYVATAQAQDLLARLRKAGMPKLEEEAKTRATLEQIERFADAFEVDLT